jgi:hypothetical protein
MIEQTIKSIEEKVRKTRSMTDQRRTELLKLLSLLKSEVEDLSKTHAEHAESIAGFTRVSAHEAMREKKNTQLLKLSTKGLSSSVEGFESSHPKLVEIVNAISHILSNMGI